jgi:Uma2 family endonuclease
MPVTEQTYECLALEDDETKWELIDGRLRAKPGMSYEHAGEVTVLVDQLLRQLDRREYWVLIDIARLRRTASNYLIPDVCVVTAEMFHERRRARPGKLATFDDPVLLVVEVWSPSTGGKDFRIKIPIYRQRGDREIWRLHPYQRTLTVWCRQADGSYTETIYRGGTVRPERLPGVTIDLDELFDLG